MTKDAPSDRAERTALRTLDVVLRKLPRRGCNSVNWYLQAVSGSIIIAGVVLLFGSAWPLGVVAIAIGGISLAASRRQKP